MTIEDIDNMEWLSQIAASMMAEAGLQGDISLHALSGGANNRVFRVDGNEHSALLKAYFQHPNDPRDRLRAEFSFSRFAWEHNVRCIPQPLVCNPQHHLALYEFIPGRQLLPHEITKEVVQQALTFYQQLNKFKKSSEAESLPIASEAYFTIADHLAGVERRFQRLKQLDNSSTINREAIHFIQHEFLKVWYQVYNSAIQQVDKLELALDTLVKDGDRCLSPSDFGFHNAILTNDKTLRFIDFEYAGWDDPAKLGCDFFCQPALPVPFEYFNEFIERIVANLSVPELHHQRILLLLPVYQIKWCCIMLNDFLPTGNTRRHFAHHETNPEKRKATQLQKARSALHKLA
jgi:thiamine kinase-like enzyme